MIKMNDLREDLSYMSSRYAKQPTFNDEHFGRYLQPAFSYCASIVTFVLDSAQ